MTFQFYLKPGIAMSSASPSMPSSKIPRMDEPNTLDLIHNNSSLLSLQEMIMCREKPNATMFFAQVWQHKPIATKLLDCKISLQDFLLITWDDVAELLERSRTLFDCEEIAINREKFDYPSLFQNLNPPLLFQHQSPLQADVIQQLYSFNPLSAYLDGCSVVINHADLIHSSLFTSLLTQLQQIFPHVFINTYLTPPNSCAVSAHADDRDVFVIQLLGSKHWQVFTSPIPFPYSEEQVGKESLPVPQDVFSRPPIIDITLDPGDVLYMPRGFVHQAQTPSSDASFHATVAIPTHDWTLARTIPTLIQKSMEKITDFRKAVPLAWLTEEPASGCNRTLEESTVLQTTEIHEAIQHACSNIHLDVVKEEMSRRIKTHNSHAEIVRSQFQQWWLTCQPSTARKQELSRVVGPYAARQLSWATSIVRTANANERSYARKTLGSQVVGLTVREENRETILGLVEYFKIHESGPVPVSNIRSCIGSEADTTSICDFTLLCFVKCCVELGSLAIVSL